MDIEIETDGRHYWLVVSEGNYVSLGDDIDNCIFGVRYSEIATFNYGIREYNDQTAQYEYLFEKEQDAINAAKMVRILINRRDNL